MYKYFFLNSLFIFWFSSHGQNLVPNPGFEQTVTCNYPLIDLNPGDYPYSVDTSETYTPSLTHWFTNQSADYFNICNPCFPHNYYKFLPRTGNGYVGIISINRFDSTIFPNYKGTREFIETKLVEPLRVGCQYQVSFYVRLNPTPHVGVRGVLGIDGMGMFLSENRMDETNWYMNIPQIKNADGNILNDTSGYVQISGIYTALGGERYISIGNFKTDTNTTIQIIQPSGEWGVSGSYYLIDDVSIIPLETFPTQLTIGKDTILCSKDLFPLTISVQSDFERYEWSTGESGESIQVQSPGTYWVRADFGCGFLTDSITIYSKDLLEDKIRLEKDTVFCDNIPFDFFLTVPNGPYKIKWSTNEIDNTIFISSQGAYWVDLETSCGVINDTIIIQTQSSFQPVFLGNDSLICDTTNLTLALKVENSFEKYLWSTGDTSSNIIVNEVGKYWVTTYFKCGSSTDSIIFSTMEMPSPIFYGMDTTFCDGLLIDFTIPGSVSKYNYQWELSNNNSLLLSNTGIYNLFISNECYSITDSIQVHFTNCELFIPNLISFNKDGKNDTFEIISSTDSPLQVTIFNSWGQRVYYSDNYQNDWSPDAISSGIYYYVVREELSSKEFKGWVQIISK